MEKELLTLISGKCISDESAKSAVKEILDAGYRLDPYPNGKSKGELIARVVELEGQLLGTRELLRQEHSRHFRGIWLKHMANDPDCNVCTFLAETSTVKS